MSRLALLLHPSEDVRAQLSGFLQSAGFRVLTAADRETAEQRLESLRISPPDVILTPLAPENDNGSGHEAAHREDFLARLRSSALTRDIPVVVLAEGGAEERRRALRLGLGSLLTPPFEGEEVVLATLLASERQRDDRNLSGSLAQLSVPDLLQTAEANRKSGRISLRHGNQEGARQGTLWLRDGRVVNAEVEGGPRGREGVYEMAFWEEGTFLADFTPVAVPERIFEPTAALLLEAMRRRDELLRDTALLHAALPDPPPPPPLHLLAVHRALTLLNVAASYAAEHMEPELLARRLEEARHANTVDSPELAMFQVSRQGAVSLLDLSLNAGSILPEPAATVLATARWLRHWFAGLEHALPGRFTLRRLRSVTEAIQEDLSALGFYRELGLQTEMENGTGEHDVHDA